MAITLNNLAADIYKAADTVGRELVGIIPSITINGDASTRAAKGDVIRSHFTRTPVVNSTYAPSMTVPEGTDQTVDNKTLTIDNFASVQIPWTGEEIKHVNNGSGYETIYGDQIKQALRAIVNTIEGTVWTTARAGASRAFGTAGTTPFAANFNEVAEIRQILVDNGMDTSDGMSTLILNSLAGTKLRNLAQLQKVNEGGGSNLLRQGELLNLQGLMLKESNAIGAVAKGTGSAYTTNATGYAVGATSITLITGTGTILAGDTVTFAGDTNRYVVATGIAGAGALVIAEPGLRVAIGAAATAVTVGNIATANIALHKSAVELVCRPIALPAGGDAATDMMTVQDPWSGLVFDISVYKGYKKSMMEVSCLYGSKAWKSQHIAQLLG